MFAKIDPRTVRQLEEDVLRSWYHDLSADVLVEHDRKTGALLTFEIDWEEPGGVHPFVRWSREGGLCTGTVDTGDCIGAFHHKRSPLLIWDLRIRPGLAGEARRLIEGSAIEEGIRRTILDRLTA